MDCRDSVFEARNKYEPLRCLMEAYWEDWSSQYHITNGIRLTSNNTTRYYPEFKATFFYVIFKDNWGGRFCYYTFDVNGNIILKFGAKALSYPVTEFINEHNVLNFPFLFSLYCLARAKTEAGRN